MKKAAPVFFVILSALFLFSAFMIAKELYLQKEDKDNFQDLAELIAVQGADTTQKDENLQGTDTETVAEETVPLRNLEPLFAQNKDCIGWVYIANTEVNYPVMHTPGEPERYLRRNFNRKSSTAGVPFLDGSNTLSDDNLIVYGHNMRNGTMFADITKYKDKSYYDAHPLIELETAEGVRQFSVFAVVKLKADDSWYSFRNGKTEEEFTNTVAEIKQRALFDTGITPAYGKQLLTLSTCYGANKDDRIVVIAAEIN